MMEKILVDEIYGFSFPKKLAQLCISKETAVQYLPPDYPFRAATFEQIWLPAGGAYSCFARASSLSLVLESLQLSSSFGLFNLRQIFGEL